MADDDKAQQGGRQHETSRQSGTQGAPKSQGGRSKAPAAEEGTGIGSSQGQDRGSSHMNESQSTQQGSGSSMVNESTGAFKERP